MKKYIILFLGISFMLLFAGCAHEEPDAPASGDKYAQPDTQINGDKYEQPDDQNLESVPDNIPPEEADENQSKSYKEMGIKEDWEMIEQRGVEADGIGFNIRRSFTTSIVDEVLPICYSAEYDALYYINYSENSFIYRLKDDEIKIAVQIPAEHLYMNGGELYFRVVNVYDSLEGVEVGDICKYSPLTGEICKIIEGAAADWMTVTQAGIFYESGNETFYYDLAAKNTEKVSAWPKKLFWKEGYSVVPYSSSLQGGNEGIIGLGLHKTGDGLANVKPITLEGMANSFCVEGDILYCQNGLESTFKIIDLNSGDMKEYQAKKGKKNMVSMANFVVRNNLLQMTKFML